MSATVRELAARLVRDSHREWFNSMSLKDKLIFLLYSVRFGVEGDHMSEKARQSCSDDAEAFVAALDAAGFAIVPKALLKPKVNAKAFARLDEMAEADIAMDGDHALSILLKHYRELTAAKEPTP